MDQTGTMNPGSGTMSTTSTGTGGNGGYGSDVSRSVENGVARTVDNASATAHSTIDRLSSAARPAVDKLTTGAHTAVDKLAGAASTAADTLAVKGEQLKDAQARFTEECRVYVRTKPLASIGIAFAVGYVLSRLMRSSD